MKTPIGNQLPRRTILWLQADKKCHWCGRATLLCDNVAPDQATVDHSIPRGRGGRYDGYQNNNVVARKHRCEVDDSSDVLFSIGLAEAETSRQVLSDYVSVQLLNGNAVRLQASKESVAEGRLSGCA
jgi:hypothetical protein